MTISSNSDEIQNNTAVTKPEGSSGSEGFRNVGKGVIDDKKRRRMESNRESARRSRKKKQDHLDGLIAQIGNLRRENEEFGNRIGRVTSALASMDAQNAVLKAEKDRLAARLETLERIAENGDKGSRNKGGEVGLYDDCMTTKPWQLPCYSLPIAASSSAAFRSTNDYYGP